MTTELFLGGLIVLTMAAIVIVALTTDRRAVRSDKNDRFRPMDSNGKMSRSDR
jgi:hypothetical protein